VPLEIVTPETVEAVTHRFRATLLEHFQKWQPSTDAAAWDLFATDARAEAERGQRADDELLRTLAMTIDSA